MASRLSDPGSPAAHGSGHIVQFYEDDVHLIDQVSRRIGSALGSGAAGVVIATEPHRHEIESRLRAQGVDYDAALGSGRYVPLDAAETLSGFMADGSPEEARFSDVVGGVFRRMASVHPGARVSAFGEMVALLGGDGNWDAAIRLEQLWNDLARRHEFTLLCAYPLKLFGTAGDAERFRAVCSEHSSVIPAETFSSAAASDQQFREIARLQQMAEAFGGESSGRRRAEDELTRKLEELAELNRRKDEFLAMLGHELRNPLAPIFNAIHLLRLEHGATPVQQHACELIERHTALLARLVDDLLEVSRFSTGRVSLRPERIAIAGAIEQAVDSARELCTQRRHRLAVSMPEESLWVDADPARLGQVFINLLNNAAKYTPEGGRVEIQATAEGADVVVSVRDNGAGIPSDLLPHIFELFVQGERSADRREGGLGIGLALVHSLVLLHGGTVRASSELGRGSEFVVRLPRVPSPMSGTAPAARGAPANETKLRLLVVDDNVDAASSLGLLLETCGHEVILAHDGRSALALAIECEPAVVLMDIGLPEIDGYDLARQIRRHERLGRVALIAITGYGQPHDRERSKLAGFDHHLVKPASFETIRHVLDSIVTGAPSSAAEVPSERLGAKRLGASPTPGSAE